MAVNDTDVGRYIDRVMGSLKPIENFAKLFCTGLTALIFAFSIAVGVQTAGGAGARVFFLAVVTGLIVMAAALAVGCLLGFLFGIPRSLQGSAPTRADVVKPANGATEPRTAANVARAFLSNTSLEEISDWLTKIIIGLGLVQFQLLIDYLYRCALYAGSFVASQRIPAGDLSKLDYDAKVSSPFFFALIVTALIAGCLFAYLETRTRLMLLFIDAEGANKDHGREIAEKASETPVSVQQSPPQSTEPKRQAPTPPIAVRPTQEDFAVTKVPLDSLKNAKEVTGWASAQARIGNFAEAERGLLDGLQKYPGDDSIRELIVEVRRLAGDDLGALKMIVEIANRTADSRKRYELLRSALYESLYIGSPDGFTEALEISQKLLDMPESAKNATGYLWRASALGQKYLWLKGKDTPVEAPQMKEIWQEALKLIGKVVELVPNYDATERELLRSLYEGSFGGEDDLKVFKSDEFDNLVYQGRS